MRIQHHHTPGFHSYSGLLDTPAKPGRSAEPRISTTAWDAASQVLDHDAALKNQLQSTMKAQFGDLAQDSAKFHATMKQVFGPNYDQAKAEGFRQQALKGDFSWLPPVRLLDAASLNGANGAYDAKTGVVYINRELAEINPGLAASTYVEEAGHHLDATLNTVDSRGDEGELFRRVLGGEKLSAAQVQAIRNENDKGVITVDGKQVEVEFWNPFKAIGDAAKAVGKAVSGAAKAVGDAIGGAAKAVANGAANLAKGVGNAVVNVGKGLVGGIGGFFGNVFQGKFGTAFEKLGAGLSQATFGAVGSLWNGAVGWSQGLFNGFTHLLPVVGEPLRKAGDHVFGAVKTLGNGALNAGATFFQGVAEAAGTAADGLKDIVTGKFGDGFKKLGMSLFKGFIQTPGDVILMAGGHAVSAIQTLIGVESPGRKLTDHEISVLKEVYGDSIDYDKVVIKEGDAGLFSNTDRPFVLGNTIYMKEWKGATTQAEKDALLVHEAAHIWQNQNGGGDYALEALWSQENGHGYDWETSVRDNVAWSELEPEQQAELMEAAYDAGYFTSGQFVQADGDNYTAYMDEVMRQVRDGEGAP